VVSNVSFSQATTREIVAAELVAWHATTSTQERKAQIMHHCEYLFLSMVNYYLEIKYSDPERGRRL
jgi:hypothetical protein